MSGGSGEEESVLSHSGDTDLNRYVAASAETILFFFPLLPN